MTAEWGLTPEESAKIAANGPSLREEPGLWTEAWWGNAAAFLVAVVFGWFFITGVFAVLLPAKIITVHPPVLFSGAVVLDSAGAPISNVLSPLQAQTELRKWKSGEKRAANVSCPCSTLPVSVIATLPDSLNHVKR